MEKKISTYSESNVRLQLLKVDDFFEIRFNRMCLKRDKDLQYLRYYFVNLIHLICIMRQSPLSNIT